MSDTLIVITRAPHTPDRQRIVNMPVLRTLIEARLRAWVFEPRLFADYTYGELEEWDEAEETARFEAWLPTHLSPAGYAEVQDKPVAFLQQLFQVPWQLALDNEIEDERVQAACRDYFWECYENLGQDAVLDMFVEGMPQWVTGGEAYGGSDPNDSYKYLEFIAETCVFDEPFELPAGTDNSRWIPETQPSV